MRNAIIAREQLTMLIRRIFGISILIAVMELPAEKLELINNEATEMRFEMVSINSRNARGALF